jgi:hypothetical protein
MNDQILKAIDSAMEASMNEFLENPDIIFFDEKEQLKFRYSVSDEHKNWKKNKKCIVKGCTNKSIERSHTIQKSGSIKQISEEGHVLTPNFNSKTGEIEVKKIGVNDASTFPGYCTEHENLFSDFEKAKDFVDGEHFALQLYRTVCREIVINENHLKTLDLLVERYKEYRDKKIKESIINKLPPSVLNNPVLELKKFTIKSNEYRLRASSKKRKELVRYLGEFLYKYHDAILKDLKKKNFTNIAHVAIHFDRQIPVALAGRGNFHTKWKTRNRNIEVIFNVLPLEGKTYIFISTLKKYQKQLKFYMDHFLNPLQTVSMVENWMIHGSDHWFIKPSIWNSIEPGLQHEILNKILNDKFNISDELDYSIFKDIKSESIDLMEKNYSTLTEPLIHLLNKEKAKLISTNGIDSRAR